MTKCKACGREFRRGVIVMLLAGDVARSARVCQACAAGGMTVVAAKVAPKRVYQGGRLEGFEGAIKVIEREVLGQVSEEGPR